MEEATIVGGLGLGAREDDGAKVGTEDAVKEFERRKVGRAEAVERLDELGGICGVGRGEFGPGMDTVLEQEVDEELAGDIVPARACHGTG